MMGNPFVIIFGTLVIEGIRDYETEVPNHLKPEVDKFLKEKGREDLIK